MYCKYCGKLIDDDSVYCRFCGKQQSEQTNTPPIKTKAKQEKIIHQERIRPIDYQDAYNAQFFGVNPYDEEETTTEEATKRNEPAPKIQYLNEGYEYNHTIPPPSKEDAKIANGIVITGRTILRFILITLAFLTFYFLNILFYQIYKYGGEPTDLKNYLSEFWDGIGAYILLSVISTFILYVIRWIVKGAKWVKKNKTI